MKTLMKKIGGCKKDRFWNMARFQTRRWHREQAQAAAAAANKPPSANATAPRAQHSAGPSIHEPSNPVIQPMADLAPATHEHPTAPKAIPSPGGEGKGEGGLSSYPPIFPSSNRPPSSVSSVKSVVGPSSALTVENPKWDKNQNLKMSQPSVSATSANKVGTPVPPVSACSSSSCSSSSSNLPPLPQSPAKQPKSKNAFLHLRANGWSLRSISTKLGVPKSTLFNWESDRETRRTIDVLKSLQIEKLQ